MSVPVLKTAIADGGNLRSFSIVKSVCILLQALISIPCLSQTIGNWAFSGNVNGTGGTYNTVSTADFSAGIPTRAFNGAEYYGENGWPAGGINTSMYMQFSITPNSGYQLDLTRIILRVRRSNTGTPQGSGPTSWSIRSSIDGYAADITTGTMTHNYANYTVNLNSSFYHAYSTVTFRVYGYTSSAPSDGTRRVVFDNISIEGIGSILPLTLTGIQAQRANNNAGVSVKWQVNNVEAGTALNVQRSSNGMDFTTLNSVTEKEYKTTYQYNYLDNQAPAATKLYYRIHGVTPSGSTFVSPVVKIAGQAAGRTLINYTSIQGQTLHTSLQTPEAGNYTVSLIYINGQLLQQRKLALEEGTHVITLPLQTMPHGTYVVRFANGKVGDSRKVVY